MRHSAILGLAILVLSAGKASAQTKASTILGGVPPSALQYKPIDVSNSLSPKTGLSAQQNRFNFSEIFNKNLIPKPGKIQGVSPLPGPASFPSSYYKNYQMVGKPPFLLNWLQKPLSAPVAPIVPNTKTPVGPGSNN